MELSRKVKGMLVQWFCTKIGWAAISMILVVIFGSLGTHSSIIENGFVWCDYAIILPGLYLAILTVVMIAYAWVINPIRAYKENKKEREAFKNKMP